MKFVGVTLAIAIAGFVLGAALGSVETEITIEGDFGTVTIVGDDAESFLDSVFPVDRAGRLPK